MNYADILTLFQSRKKGRDYKVFRNAWEHIRLDPDSGALTLSNNCSVWEQDEGGRHKRVVRPGTPVLRFTPDNVLEVLHSPTATGLSDRLMIEKATGGAIYMRSPKFEYRLMLSFRYSSIEHASKDIPLVAGLKIDLNTKQPITRPEQVKLSTNRTTAQPVYKHVRQVGKVMDLLWRLGGLEVDDSNRWRYQAVDASTPVELCEETLAVHAQAAIHAGWNRGQVDTHVRDPETNQYKKRPEADVRAEEYAKARTHGLKRLTEFLKPHHGAIVRTVVA